MYVYGVYVFVDNIIMYVSLTLLFSYVITELLQSDLHKIIVSPQHLSADHIKVFLYQILRGKHSDLYFLPFQVIFFRLSFNTISYVRLNVR